MVQNNPVFSVRVSTGLFTRSFARSAHSFACAVLFSLLACSFFCLLTHSRAGGKVSDKVLGCQAVLNHSAIQGTPMGGKKSPTRCYFSFPGEQRRFHHVQTKFCSNGTQPIDSLLHHLRRRSSPQRQAHGVRQFTAIAIHALMSRLFLSSIFSLLKASLKRPPVCSTHNGCLIETKSLGPLIRAWRVLNYTLWFNFNLMVDKKKTIGFFPSIAVVLPHEIFWLIQLFVMGEYLASGSGLFKFSLTMQIVHLLAMT